MADKGLSEAEREIIIDKDAKSTGKELCDYIDELLKTARLQTLEDVEKALMKRTVINECGISVYAKHILDEIKTLREAL